MTISVLAIFGALAVDIFGLGLIFDSAKIAVSPPLRKGKLRRAGRQHEKAYELEIGACGDGPATCGDDLHSP
jgi:hypothetical protein